MSHSLFSNYESSLMSNSFQTMDSFENNNEIIDAIQARENDLKNQQIQLGKEIKVSHLMSHRMSHNYD